MANAQSLSNALASKGNQQQSQEDIAKKMRRALVAMRDEIGKGLMGTNLTAERFERLVFSAWNSNPKLKLCTPISFLAAAMTSAQLGLEPNTPLGQAYIIPYGTKATFQIGYKGLLTLLYRSGEILMVDAQVVYEKDEFDYEYGSNARLYHKPHHGADRGKIIAYYAIVKYLNGGETFRVMYPDQVEEVRTKFSKSANSSDSPWRTDYNSMALKTVLLRTIKYGPLSVELARTVAQDGAIRSNLSENLLDSPVDPETWDVAEPEVVVRDAEPEKAEEKVKPLTAEQVGFVTKGGEK